MTEIEAGPGGLLGPEGSGRVGASSPPSLRQLLGLAGAVVGLSVAFASCVCGPAMTVLVELGSEIALDEMAVQQTLALSVLGGGLGLAVALEGWRVWQRRPSPPFHPQRTWVLWLILLPLLMTGFLVSTMDLAPAYLLPFINTLTMLLLPALVLGMVGRALGGAGGSWRDVLGGVVSGASLGTGLAVVLEIGLLAFLVAGALVMGLLPADLTSLESWEGQLNDPSLLYDPETLLELLSPTVIAAVFLFVAVLTPLAEEMTKTLGVGIAGAWLRPAPARAFLLGAASGAGFALAENLLNGAIIGSLWGPGTLSRLAATLMHCATGGLMGWGWGELWGGKHPWRLVLSFTGAVMVHGVWNGLAVGAAVGGLMASASEADPAQAAAAGLAVAVLVVLLMLIAIAALVGIVWAARRLGQKTV